MKNRSVRPHRGIRNSRADRVFYGVNGVLMALTFLLYAWPLWFVLIASFSDPNLVQAVRCSCSRRASISAAIS